MSFSLSLKILTQNAQEGESLSAKVLRVSGLLDLIEQVVPTIQCLPAREVGV
jgi:hypothetical protein